MKSSNKYLIISIGLQIALVIAILWPHMPSQFGDTRAEAARKYAEGIENFNTYQNYDIAYAAFLEAAQLNHEKADYQLGWMYENGFGTQQSYEKAYEHYSKGMENGNADAICRMGYLEITGLGTQKYAAAGVRHCTRAFHEGAHYAAMGLADYYIEGKHLQKSIPDAIMWLEQAAQKDYQPAIERLINTYTDGDLVEANPELVKQYQDQLDLLQSSESPVPTLEHLVERIEKSKASDALKKQMTSWANTNFGGYDKESHTIIEMIEKLLEVPFETLATPPVTFEGNTEEEINTYLQESKAHLDHAVYGHDETKTALLRLVAQTLSNPQEQGNVLGIQGHPGIGKTKLIQEGVAKMLDRPMVKINLGGARNSAFLIGSERVWLGSTWGQIVEGLIQKGVMNPIFYFDEVDKVSDSPYGKEIINALIHLTDSTQNDKFQDRYFREAEFDLSQAIFVFSFNRQEAVDPILLDRMSVVNAKGYSVKDKLAIAEQFSIPRALEKVNLSGDEVVFAADAIEAIIEDYTYEAGVRRMEEHILTLVREVNLKRMLEEEFKLPFVIDRPFLDGVLEGSQVRHSKIDKRSAVGAVNGLYATDLGIGGIAKFHVVETSSQGKGPFVLTGNVKEMTEESTHVAYTVAWNRLNHGEKSRFGKNLEKTWHIHRSEVSVPMDGPSAGAALSLAFYSAFTEKKIKHDVALTGEIDLRGKVLPIGGLGAKLKGAKDAGVRLVLVPKGNKKELDEVRIKSPELFGKTFKVVMVATFDDVLKAVF